MNNRIRIAVGSLLGAAAIHLAFLACSQPHGHGDDAASGMDAVTSEVASMADTVTAAEVGQAEAQTPPADAGACTCTPPAAQPASFYFVAPAGMRLRQDYSAATASARAAIVNNQPGRSVALSGQGYLGDGTSVSLSCAGAGTLAGSVQLSCTYSSTAPSANGTGTQEVYQGSYTALDMTTTDTEVIVRIPSMTLPKVGAPSSSVTLTDVQFHGYGRDMLHPGAAYARE